MHCIEPHRLLLRLIATKQYYYSLSYYCYLEQIVCTSNCACQCMFEFDINHYRYYKSFICGS